MSVKSINLTRMVEILLRQLTTFKKYIYIKACVTPELYHFLLTFHELHSQYIIRNIFTSVTFEFKFQIKLTFLM